MRKCDYSKFNRVCNAMRVAILCMFFTIQALCGQEPAKAPATPNLQADLSALSAGYKADLDDIAADYEKWFTALQTWYLAGLDKLQSERTKAGDLEGVLAFKEERDRIAGRVESTREQIQAMPAVLGKLRAAYDPALKKIKDEAGRRKSVAQKKYLANLEGLQKRLTVSLDLDDAVLVRKEKERLAAEMAEAGGGAVVTPPEPSPKKASEPFQGSRNLLAGEDARKWTIVRGDWTTDNNVLTGAGNSSIVFTDELSPPFTLQFKINVLEGMRPRVRFGPFEFGNEGFETTFALYPKPTGELFHYQRKTSYGIAISVSQKSVDLSIDGNLIASRPGVKEKLDKLDFLAGDNWSKGRVEFRDITLAK